MFERARGFFSTTLQRHAISLRTLCVKGEYRSLLAAMLLVLYHSKEFQHVPMKERQKAAWEARQRAMRHWQFWLAIVLMMIATVVGSLIAQNWFGDGRVSGFRGQVLTLYN